MVIAPMPVVRIGTLDDIFIGFLSSEERIGIAMVGTLFLLLPKISPKDFLVLRRLLSFELSKFFAVSVGTEIGLKELLVASVTLVFFALLPKKPPLLNFEAMIGFVVSIFDFSLYPNGDVSGLIEGFDRFKKSRKQRDCIGNARIIKINLKVKNTMKICMSSDYVLKLTIISFSTYFKSL
jgi:hypothetical protein